MKNIFGAILAGTILIGPSLEAVQPYESINTLPPVPYYMQDAYTILSLANSHSAQSDALNIKAGLICLSGVSEAIYKDILNWYNHVADNGVICGNNWNDVSVQRDVTQAAALLNVPVQVNANF